MSPNRRTSYESVVEMLVREGSPPEAAREIVETLAGAGLSAPQARQWLSHPQRAYLVVTGHNVIDGVVLPREQTPIFAIEDGHVPAVREAAARFAGASEDERFISWWFGGDIDATRRLTAGDPQRATVIAAIARRLQHTLRKPEHVRDVVLTEIPMYGGRRIVDLLLADRQDAVLDDLVSGRVDANDLLQNGTLGFSFW
jgi:hypothetical protein